jgi:8-oxo-dGTP diphosphatase
MFRGTRYRQREQFFLARTDRFNVDSSQMDELEKEIVRGHRWWDVVEIEAATDVTFAPRMLGHHLRALVQGTIPKEPIDVGL